MALLANNPAAGLSEQFHLLVDAVQDYAIFMLDETGHVVTWNTGARRIKGYTPDEIIGKHFSVFYTPEERAAGKPERALKCAAQEGRYQQEGWRVRKDDSRFWALAILTALRAPDGQLIGFAKVTRDFTERREMERQLEASEQSLRDLSLHLLRTQDEERRRIGRDLHDSLGQFLAALKMRIEIVARRCEPDADLADSVRLVDECIREVRTLSYLLHPPLLEESGLESAIRWYLDGFGSRSRIQVDFEAEESFPRLDREVELALFRVLQESLTNVHRHSGSPTAQVNLNVQDGEAILEVSDQGRGMDADLLTYKDLSVAGRLGIGLRGMSERMRQLGGRIQVFSSSPGTTVRATIPIATGTHET